MRDLLEGILDREGKYVRILKCVRKMREDPFTQQNNAFFFLFFSFFKFFISTHLVVEENVIV